MNLTISYLEEQIHFAERGAERNRENAKHEDNEYAKGLYSGWAACYENWVDWLKSAVRIARTESK